MNDRSLWIVLAVLLVSLAPLSGTTFAQDEAVVTEEPAATEEAAATEESASSDLMTEAQLAKVLVNVLGLAPMLPPNPQQVDVFGILLQNKIVPAAGWNPTNYVTMGTLARVLVQSMRQQDQIENPDDDASWVEYLKSQGVEFGTVEEGVDQVQTINDPVAVAAVEPSTDPLRKVPSIRPSDEQQLGADLQPFGSQLTGEDIMRIILDIEQPEVEEPEEVTQA